MRLLEIVTTSFSWLCCCTGTHPFKVSDAPSLYSNTCKRVYLAAFEYTPLICQRGSDVIGHKEKNPVNFLKGMDKGAKVVLNFCLLCRAST